MEIKANNITDSALGTGSADILHKLLQITGLRRALSRRTVPKFSSREDNDGVAFKFCLLYL